MPKRSRKSSPDTDPNVAAFNVVQRATGGTPKKNPAAVALGRLGGLKGGHARAAALSRDERSAIARKAAAKRWAASKPKRG